MVTPITLPNFSLLPPELRNIIWESSLPPTRVFDLYPASTSQKTPAHQGLRFANHHSEPPPPIAAVCREGRSLALHHYQPLTLSGTTKYVDLSRDVLLLESCLFERNLLRTLLFMSKIPLIRDGLQGLAFGTSYGVHTGLWHPVLGWKKPTKSNMGRFLDRIGAFTKLEKIIFLVHQEVQYEVAELPHMRRILRGSGIWNGQVSRNATVYEKGAVPPGLRVLMPSGQCDDDMASRASTPGSISSDSLCGAGTGDMGASSFLRLPWTDDRPWLRHENEVYYFPQQPTEDDESGENSCNTVGNQAEPPQLRGLVATIDDWLLFRRTLKRDLDAGVKLGLADPRPKSGPCKKRTRRCADDKSGGQRPLKCGRGPPGAARDGYKLPEIQGASLLWRYALPS